MQVVEDRLVLVQCLLSGRYPELYQQKLYDPLLRQVQLIGQSIQVVYTSPDDKVRMKRLAHIEPLFRELTSTWQQGLDIECWRLVMQAVKDVMSRASVEHLLSDSAKLTDRGMRAAKQATRCRYFSQALDVLKAAPPGLLNVRDQERIDREISWLREME